MIYNKISGSSIDTVHTLLFKEFEEERCYISFMREKESWSTCALINISLNDKEIKNVIATVSGEDNKFTDRDVSSYNEVDTYVYIYKTDSLVSDFNTDLINYTKIDELETYPLKLIHVNSSWAVIKGLPAKYQDYINNTNGEKFYIIKNNTPQYSTNPDNIEAIAKINDKSIFDQSIYNEDVILKAVKDNIEIPAIYGLNKSTNILGEVLIDGVIESNFNTPQITEQILFEEYAINGTELILPTTPYFILRNAINQNTVVFKKMYLIKTQDEDGEETIWHVNNYTSERYLLFKSSNEFQSHFYVKMTLGSSVTGLAIYHESLPYTFNVANNPNNISDANPPGIDSTYLKNQQLHVSFFDVKGLVKIKKNKDDNDLPSELYSKVSFVRELKDENEKTKYLNYGFTISNDKKRIEEVQITSDESVIHFGNIRKNPKNASGNYISGVSRIYLFTNNFVIGDTIQIKYWNESHTEFDPLETQTTNSLGEPLTIVGISYQEDNYYIELNGVTNKPIIFYEATPTEEARSYEYATITSTPTNVAVKVRYAVCDSYKDALRYNMNSIMIDMKIPTSGTDLYSGIYRQLSICHQPKYNNNGVMTTCTADYYNDGLFDFQNHEYDMGVTFFLANKNPIYRQYLKDKEVFKLII